MTFPCLDFSRTFYQPLLFPLFFDIGSRVAQAGMKVCYVAEDNLQFLILLLLALKCWGCGHGTQWVYAVLRI